MSRHSSKTGSPASPDFSRSIAVLALTFLAADAGRLARFLAITGLGPSNLRRAADEPGFYGSILEYVVGDEPLLLAFAADAGLKPEAVARAREILAGAPEGGEP